MRGLVCTALLGGLGAAPLACDPPEETLDEGDLEELAREAPREDAVREGPGRYEFTGTPLAEERPVPVWYYLPEGLGADAPVVLVAHGAARDAEGHRDAWREMADDHGFAVVAPEFADREGRYPGTEAYNLGRVEDEDGALRPRDRWSFSILEPLFDDFVSRADIPAETYHLYGHSAGSQVAHRFLTLFPEARAERVVLANAGWYTLPVAEEEWPYGLAHPEAERAGGVLATPEDLATLFARDVTILLGEEDVDTAAAHLRTTEPAAAQGAHRFQRGHTYHRVVRERARELDLELRWKLDTVPDAGHSNAEMAPAAAEVIGGG